MRVQPINRPLKHGLVRQQAAFDSGKPGDFESAL
jgi:hypothetical protein